MFRSFFRSKKSSQENVANNGKLSLSQQSVPDARADAARPVSAPPPKVEEIKERKKKKKWRTRLFSFFQKNDCNSAAETSKTTTKKQSFWLFELFKRKNLVSQASMSETSSKTHPKKAADEINSSRIEETSKCEEVSNTKVQTTKCFGFPNIDRTCFMNSCLQSLLSLKEFMRDISCHKDLWASVPEAQLLRHLTDIMHCQASQDFSVKIGCLFSFKITFATYAPEYQDWGEKDAHEFLTLLLNKIQTMFPELQNNAVLLGKNYTCPVKYHLGFQMYNVRTCKSCGDQTSHQVECIILSLDLIVEGSILDILEAYLMDKELEFKCECGGTTSGLKLSFDTLPRVLILHLKRVCVTPTYKLEKIHDPVSLQKELMVSSNQGCGRYSLVSIIGHCGSVETGHYISNSIHPDDSPDGPADRWLTFNYAEVYETTGSTVCEAQKHFAYILFYKRQV